MTIKNFKYNLIILLTTIVFPGFGQISFPEKSQFYYLKGKDATNIPANWYENDFNTSSWAKASAPFWYGDGEGGTVLNDMYNSYSTLYLKGVFSAQKVQQLSNITINANFDDGFIMYINGNRALAVNEPTNPVYNSAATNGHESGTWTTYSVGTTDLDLVEGVNTIAIQGFNFAPNSSDFHMDFALSAQPETFDSTAISFNHKSGFYEDKFTLTMSHPNNQLKIIYTLDGSNPQNSKTAFTANNNISILINPNSTGGRSLTPGVVLRASILQEGNLPSKPIARTFLFLDEIKKQGNPGGDWPDYNVNNQIIDYEMDPDVVNSGTYASQINKALTDIPSISIITDNKNLFDPTSGIYVNAAEQGYDWERECSVEMLDINNKEGFNVNAGLRIRGGWSRHPNYPKHAFRLFFRKEYGFGKLKYPLFEEEGVDEFDKIDLRCAQNYGWQNSSGEHNTFLREIFTRDSQRDSGQPYTRSRYYHLYLNGMYWGLYQTQERAEARFAADYLGGSSSDYDVVKVSGENYDRTIMATDGNLDGWKQVWDLCQTGFKNNENYNLIQGKDAEGNFIKDGEILVDIDNLIDYMINIFYSGNFDSPTGAFSGNKEANNMYNIFDRKDKSAGFKFFIHDGEHALAIDGVNPGIGLNENRVNIGTRSGNLRMSVTKFENFHPQWLHFKLSENEEYRVRFSDRATKQLTGKGIFTPEACLDRLEPRYKQIEYAIIAESARWGDSRRSTPYTKHNAWIPEVNKIRNTYFPNRTNIVINQLEEADLYSNIPYPNIFVNEADISNQKVEVQNPTTIQFENVPAEGDIYYTIDGTDPRMTGGGISEKAQITDNNNVISFQSSTIIKARTYTNEKWSALNEVSLLMKQLDYSSLKITELHYHPADFVELDDTSSGKNYEFIEFKNTSKTSSINLTGLVIDSAIHYTFPEDYILPPQQFFVAASKPSKFFNVYGLLASGNFSKNFSNGGEEVLVTNKDGETVMNFAYDDIDPWPEAADGKGPSLVSYFTNPTENPNDYSYWASSFYDNGSPFKDDTITISLDTEGPLAEQKPIIQVYPNPTNNNLHFSMSANNETIYLRLMNLNGSVVYQTTINSNHTLSLKALQIPGGLYLLEMDHNQQKNILKIIYKAQ